MASKKSMIWELIGIDRASDAMRAVGNAAEKTQQQSDSLLATVAKYASFALVSSQVWQMTNAASDLGEAVNLNERIFKRNSAEIREWAEGGADAFGLSTTAALEMSAQMGGALSNLGYDLDDATVATQGLIERAGDMASAFNTEVSQAIFAIQAGLRGETEPLRKFNVFLNEATIKAKALSMGLYSGKGALDQYGKAMAVQAIIMEDTAAIQGDFALTADGLANSQRRLTAHTENLKATMGNAFLPVAEVVFGVLNNLAASAEDMNPKIGQSAIMFALVGSAAIALAPMLSKLWATLSGGAGGLGGLAQAFVSVGKAAAVTAAVMIAMDFAKGVREWKDLTEALDEFQDALRGVNDSGEIEVILDAQGDRIDMLREKLHYFRTASDDDIGAIVEAWKIAGVTLGDQNSLNQAAAIIQAELTQATQEYVENGLKKKEVAAMLAARQTKYLADTMETSTSGAEAFQGIVSELKDAMDNGTAAVDAYRKAIKALQDVMFGTEKAEIAYEQTLADTTAGLQAVADAAEIEATALRDLEGVLDITTQTGRDVQSMGHDLAGAMGEMVVESFDLAGGMTNASEAFDTAQAKAAELHGEISTHLIDTFGFTQDQVDDLIGSYEDWNSIETVLHELGVDVEGAENGFATAETHGDNWDSREFPDKEVGADSTPARNAFRGATEDANEWNDLNIPGKKPRVDASGGERGFGLLNEYQSAWQDNLVITKRPRVEGGEAIAELIALVDGGNAWNGVDIEQRKHPNVSAQDAILALFDLNTEAEEWSSVEVEEKDFPVDVNPGLLSIGSIIETALGWVGITIPGKETPVDPGPAQSGFGQAEAAADGWNGYSISPKDTPVSPAPAVSGFSVAGTSAYIWNRLGIPQKDTPVDSGPARSGFSVAGGAASAWNRTGIPGKKTPVDAYPALIGSSLARTSVALWNRQGVSSKKLHVWSNAGSQAYFAQQYINSVRGRRVYLDIVTRHSTTARAEGGPVFAGHQYLVGERGTELFVPEQNGWIVSNADLTRQQEPVAARPSVPWQSSGDGGGGGYAPIVLQMDSRTVWQGLVRLRKTRSQALGLG